VPRKNALCYNDLRSGITNLINNGATFFYTRIVSLQEKTPSSRSAGLVVKEVERSCSGRPGNGTE